jgi:hypothetical protein
MNLSDFNSFLEKIGEEDLKNKSEDILAKIRKKVIENQPTKQELKEASAFIEDIQYKDLTPEVKKEVDRFVTCKSDTKLIHYGMVVKELLDKVDSKNYETAKEHVKDKDVDKDELYKKIKDKYVIVINDHVVDGHHLIAKCEKVGVTSSLNILDLTPARFQKKAVVKMTLWDILKERI